VIKKKVNADGKEMEEGEMSPEKIMDIEYYENDDSTHHYPGHVDKENVEVEVLQDNFVKDDPVNFTKNERTIPWNIGVTIATKAGR